VTLAADCLTSNELILISFLLLIKRQGDMIILAKLLVGDLIFNVISAYAPQIGLNESVKMQF
jgi:hypothetical protein